MAEVTSILERSGSKEVNTALNLPVHGGMLDVL